jgi:hypothetical protein
LDFSGVNILRGTTDSTFKFSVKVLEAIGFDKEQAIIMTVSSAVIPAVTLMELTNTRYFQLVPRVTTFKRQEKKDD